MQWALVDQNLIIQNLIVYDGISTFTPEDGLTLLQVDDGLTIGDKAS